MKIALLGTAPSSRDLAPFNDPDWEIWACSSGNYKSLPRSDVWFEMHAMDRMGNDPRFTLYLAFLAKHPKVYMQYQEPKIPGSVAYPKKEIVEEFGDHCFGGSVPWMLALAIKQNPEVIGFFGIDMADIKESGHQKCSCHCLMFEGRKRGIQFYAPPESDILQPMPLYGYREANPMFRKLKAREAELKNRVKAANQRIYDAESERTALQGALDDIDYMKKIWATQ